MNTALNYLVKDAASEGKGRLAAALGLYWRLPGWWQRLALLLYLLLDRILNAQRDSTAEIRDLSNLDFYAIFQIIATFLIGLSLVVVPNKSLAVARRVLFSFPMLWLVFYYILAVASALWSDAPLLTLFKAGQCTVFLLAIAVAIDGLTVLRYRAAYLCCVSLAYLIVAYVGYFLWVVPIDGIGIDSLHMVLATAPFLPVLFLAGLTELPRFTRAYTAIILLFVVVETTLTSYMGLCFAAGLYIYIWMPGRLKATMPVLAGIGLLLLIAMLPDDPGATLFGIKSVAAIRGGTGRFEVWNYALTEAFPQAPVLGHAFVVGDAVGRESGINAALGQLHNSHLSALLNLGLVGLCVWVAFLISSLHSLLLVPDRRQLALLCCAAFLAGMQQLAGEPASPPCSTSYGSATLACFSSSPARVPDDSIW